MRKIVGVVVLVLVCACDASAASHGTPASPDAGQQRRGGVAQVDASSPPLGSAAGDASVTIDGSALLDAAVAAHDAEVAAARDAGHEPLTALSGPYSGSCDRAPCPGGYDCVRFQVVEAGRV